MRHAFLILAYNEFWLLKKLVDFLSNNNCDIYLNLDRRAEVPEDVLLYFTSNKAVRNITRRVIHWGGHSMLECELHMLEYALYEKRADYFHLLSGQDYPIKPLSEFFAFFEIEKGKNFLLCEKADFQTIWRRLLLFQPLDWYDEREKWGEKISLGLLKFQMKFGLLRSVRHLPTTIHTGSQWFSLTKRACGFIVSYTHNHKTFFRRLRHTFVSDEIYINSILKKYYDDEKIVSEDNLRYIRWENENGNNPSNLGKEHFAILASRHEFFARKFTYRCGFELVDMIDRFLLQGTDLRKQYCEYNSYLGNFLIETLNALKIDSCLVVGNNQLYTQALLGGFMVVNGLYLNSELLEFLQAIKIDDICQMADFSEPVEMEADERFDALLLVNQYRHCGEELLFKILNSATGLTSKYVLIIEETPTQGEQKNLENMLTSSDFIINNELNWLLLTMLEKVASQYVVYLLTKR